MVRCLSLVLLYSGRSLDCNPPDGPGVGEVDKLLLLTEAEVDGTLSADGLVLLGSPLIVFLLRRRNCC